MRVTGKLYLDGDTIKLKQSTSNGATSIAAGSPVSDITLTLPTVTDTLLGRVSTDTGSNRLQNKELSDDSVKFVDNADTTKKLAFQLSGLTTGNTRTLTLADGDMVVGGNSNDNDIITKAGTQAVTNKTIVASSNTITTAASGNLAAVELNAALAELQTDIDTRATSTGLTDHINDATDAHAGSAITNTPSGNLAATTVQAALNELQGDIDTNATNISNHLSDTTDAHDASAISSVASGNLAATDVQAALNELQSDIDTRATSTDLTNHMSDTTTHGTTGDIVGTSDAQTLSNKTLTFLRTESESGTISASAIAPTKGMFRITGGGTSFHTISSPVSAQHVVLYNDSGSDITVANSGGNIQTGTGIDLTLKNGAALTLAYNSDDSKWLVAGGSGGGGLATSLKTTTFTAAAGNHYLCDTSSAGYTATLPAGASGSVIRFSDDARVWSNKNLTIAPATGESIDGLSADETLVCDVSGGFVQLMWNGTKWVVDTNGFAASILSGSAGSGSGEKNYITNPSGASATTGWSNVGYLDIARTTTASDLPREYTTLTGLKITADANTQSTADYVYFDFTLDDVDLSKKLTIKWSQKTTGSYTAGDLAVVITTQADRTTALHTPVTTAIPASTGDFVTTFDSSTTATLSLVIRATRDMTTDAGIVISDVVVGPGEVVQGAAVSEWQSFTLSTALTNEGTLSNTSAQWRRVGSDMEVRFATEMTTNPAGAITFTPPTGTVDTSKLSAASGTDSILGAAKYLDNGVATYLGNVVFTSGTGIRFFTTSGYLGTGTPFTWAAGDNWTAEFRVPIAEWAGSGTVNLGQGSQVEYVYPTGTWDSNTTTYAYGPQGAQMGTLTGTRSKTLTWQYPIQTDDLIIAEVSTDRATWMPINGARIGASGTATAISIDTAGNLGAGVLISHPTSTTTTLLFGVYANQANDDSPAANWPSDAYVRVRKAKAGAAVGFGMVTADSAGLVRGYTSMAKIRLNTGNGHGATNTKVRRFTTQVVNTGTGITYADSATLGATFTCTEAGIYAFEYADAFSGVNDLGLSLNSSQLTTNIGSITASDRLAHATTGAADYFACVSVTIALAVGDVVRAHTSGGAESSVPGRVSFTCQRIA